MLARLRKGRTMAIEISNIIANCVTSTISNTCTWWFELSFIEGLDRYMIGVNVEGMHCWFVVEDNGQLCEIAAPVENPPDPELWRKVRTSQQKMAHEPNP